MSIDKLLNSKPMHWITICLVIINIMGYISVGSVECLVVFAIGYYISNYFTKKYQALDILAGLFAANMVFGCGRIKEGFKEGAGSCSSEGKKKEKKHKKTN